jgi:hypothetical protein
MINRKRTIRFALLLSTLLAATTASAIPEYIESERPAAGDVDETPEPMEFSLRRPEILEAFTTLRETFREGTLDLRLRNYYFDRYRKNAPDSEAWTQGGWLNYETPWWKNRLRIETTLYTSQKLYGPDDKDGTLLLKDGQESFTVLGEAYLEAKLIEGMEVKLYRQVLNIPYMNRDDNRMVPNTFEGLTMIDASRDNFVYGFGQIERIKTKNSTQFVSMTEAGGIDGRHKGVSVAGFRYDFRDGSSIGAYNQYGWDFMNIFYAEGNSRPRKRGDWGLQFSAQYTDQRAAGDELAGDFDTYTYGLKAETGFRGTILKLAYTSTANNAGIRSPWGGKPSYLSIMIEDFDRAGEDAWLIGLSSDFSYFGDNGFSGFINYAKGDTPDKGRIASADQSEFDVTLDYRFREGIMKGFWVRVRGASVDRDGSSGKDVRDFRVILNHDIAIF